MTPAEIARALAQDDVEMRRRAVLALPVVSQPERGELLLSALGDEDWRVRAEAIKVGQLVAERSGVERGLIAAAQQRENIGLRSAALELLASGGETLVAALVAALPGWDEGSRRAAVDALARAGRPEAKQALGTAFDPASLSIDVLCQLEGAPVEDALRARLGAEDAFERVAALDALNRKGVVVTFGELQPLLQDRLASRGALRALGRTGQAQALPPLLEALVDPREPMAATALLALGEAAAHPRLRAELARRLRAGSGSARARLRQLGERSEESLSCAALTCLALAEDRSGAALALALVTRGLPVARIASLLAPSGRAAVDELSALVERAAPPASGLAQELLDEVVTRVQTPVPAPVEAWSSLTGGAKRPATGRGATSIFDLPRLSNDDFRALRAIIRKVSGIAVQDDARAFVERRVGERVTALGVPGFHAYLERLRQGAESAAELERVIDLVAVHETYFFREAPQLFAFEREVLPLLRAQIGARRTLTVWSAGCSTGEEVYSLAMLIARSHLFDDCIVRVVGNDISRRVLQVARKAVYRGGSFRALPPDCGRYFVDVDGGRQVCDAIRALCHFTWLNLFDGSHAAIIGRVDAVFCRNVLIYFDEPARAELVQTFHDRLLPGGFLMLGHSESLLNLSTAFELHPLSADLAYRKPPTAYGRAP